jgi:hypothetical protein
MPPIWWNHSFVSNRRIINDIEDFLEVFVSSFSYHRFLSFSVDYSSSDRRGLFLTDELTRCGDWQQRRKQSTG